jgi:hypothetical protein
MASTEGIVLDLLRRTPEGRRLVREAFDTVSARWVAFEQGRWKPPQP